MAINVRLNPACDVSHSGLHLILDSPTQIKMPNKQMVRLTGVDESTTIGKLKEMLSAGGGSCAPVSLFLFLFYLVDVLRISLVPCQLIFLLCVLLFTSTCAHLVQAHTIITPSNVDVKH